MKLKKCIKKAISICMIFMLTVCMVNPAAVETKAEESTIQYYDGSPVTPQQIDGDYADYGLSAEYDGYYAISNAAELYGFAELVNYGLSRLNGVLTSDIYVNKVVEDCDFWHGFTEDSYQWTDAIACRYVEETAIIPDKYSGIFDGNGHTISGLYVFENALNAKYNGLFGYVDGGTIKNVTLDKTFFWGEYSGGIAGKITEGSVIENCHVINSWMYGGGIVMENEGTIINCSYSDGEIVGFHGFGGGIATYNHGEISSCYNSGLLSSITRAGGIAGENTGTISNCVNSAIFDNWYIAGGIAGFNTGIIDECYNYLDVTSEEWGGNNLIIGGIAGITDDGSKIINCYSGGNIKLLEIEDTVDEYYPSAGGIAGTQNSGNCIISNCGYNYNCAESSEGSISAVTGYTGGIIGSCQGEADGLTIENCYVNIKTTEENLESEAIGIIYGKDMSKNGISITNCYYDADELSAGTACGIDTTQAEEKTTSEFNSGSVAYLLNEGISDGTQSWYQNIDNGKEPDGYPVPDSTHGTVYKQTVTKCNGTDTYEGYTNKENEVNITESHNIDGGICTECNTSAVWLQSARITEDKGEETLYVRFVSATQSLDYESVGFKMQIYIETEEGNIEEISTMSEKTITTVYNSIKAAGSIVTAKELTGAEGYIEAYTYKNIPVTGTYYFAVCSINTMESKSTASGTYKYYKISDGELSVIEKENIPADILAE